MRHHLAALALVLAPLLPATAPLGQPADPAIATAVIAGEVASPEDFQRVLVVCNNAPVAASAGLNLAPGCIVESGPTSVVATINGNEAEVIAEPGTQFDFLPDGVRVVLGQVFVKVRSLDIRGWFRLETPHGTASVRSTQFDVQVEPGRAVFRLLEGGLRVNAFDTAQQADIAPGQRGEIVDRRIVRTATMSPAEIRAVVERVRRTEEVLRRATTAAGTYVGLLVPDLQAPLAPVIDEFVASAGTLRWRTRNAVRVEISGLGSVPVSGSRQVQPAVSTVYTLTATARDGRSVSRRVTVAVAVAAPAPVIDEFRWDGETLRWRTRNAVSVELSGVGNTAANGQLAVRPEQATTYTLTARNRDGRAVRREARVPGMAPPRITEFRGDGDQLRWSVRNATRVSITELGAVPASGSRKVAPGRYILTADNDAGRSRSEPVEIRARLDLGPLITVPIDILKPRDTIEQNPGSNENETTRQPSGGIINRIPQ
jgi:hypothetical protein